MSICDVPLIADVCSAVGDATASLISAPFDFLASAIGGAAQWLFTSVWTLIDQTTLVDLTNPGYVGIYNLLFGVAISIVVIFFLAQLITGMIRRDPSALARAATGAGKAVLGSFLVITLGTLLLEVTDQLTIGVVQAAGLTMSEMGLRLGTMFVALGTLSIASPGVGAILTIFLGFLAIAGILIVWFSLLVRKALILAAIVLAPIALAGSAWDATRAWFGRWAAFVVAMIVSKLVIVVVMLVAVVQLDAPIDLDLQSIADPMAGVVLLLTAAFAPYLVYKLISFAGFDFYQTISAEQEAKQALDRRVPIPAALPPARPSDAGSPAPSGSGPNTATTAAEAGETGTSTAGTAGGGAAAGGAAGAGAAGGGSAAGGGAAAGGAAAGGAAAAGPAAIAVVAAQAAVAVAEAGPRAGAAVAGATEAQADSAQATPPQPPASPRPNTTAPATSPAPPSTQPPSQPPTSQPPAKEQP
ncbi:MAG: conjugal transfer protein TrbL [Microbacterium sp.]|nr:conjugal transfer protein TrbL [Microbacterium sp.]